MGDVIRDILLVIPHEMEDKGLPVPASLETPPVHKGIVLDEDLATLGAFPFEKQVDERSLFVLWPGPVASWRLVDTFPFPRVWITGPCPAVVGLPPLFHDCPRCAGVAHQKVAGTERAPINGRVWGDDHVLAFGLGKEALDRPLKVVHDRVAVYPGYVGCSFFQSAHHGLDFDPVRRIVAVVAGRVEGVGITVTFAVPLIDAKQGSEFWDVATPRVILNQVNRHGVVHVVHVVHVVQLVT